MIESTIRLQGQRSVLELLALLLCETPLGASETFHHGETFRNGSTSDIPSTLNWEAASHSASQLEHVRQQIKAGSLRIRILETRKQ